MLFLEKENIFKCLVAFQKMFWKIFFGVWLCSWKYHRKHIFYLLLTFSHIFLTAKRNKTQKKNSSNLVRLREEGRERGDWIRSRGKITRWMRRRDHAAEARSSSIGVDLCLIGAVRSAWCYDWRDQCDLVQSARCYDQQDRWSVGRRTGARSVVVGLELGLRTGLSLLPLSLSLSLSLRVSPEMVWSENFD